jgi:hypothetical protein
VDDNDSLSLEAALERGEFETSTEVVPRAQLEGLGNQLVWKMGRDEITERIVVRVGYASATGSFRDLPKLRGATDTEIADAAKSGELIVEWIE